MQRKMLGLARTDYEGFFLSFFSKFKVFFLMCMSVITCMSGAQGGQKEAWKMVVNSYVSTGNQTSSFAEISALRH